jgi:hypothetical protein
VTTPCEAEPKVKINEFNRHLFPELAKDLEENGQLQPVLVDEDGYIHDGAKRVILCGIEQLKKNLVPRDSECSNFYHLSKPQKQALIKMLYEQLCKTEKKSYAADILAKRYNIGRATVYRWLNERNVSNETKSKGKERLYKDTATWNPFVGREFGCNYCKPSFQNNHYFVMQHRRCGLFYPHEHPERLDLKKIPNEEIVFVCGDSDIAFASPEYMRKVFEIMKQDTRRGRIWFLQSKDPKCFQQYLKDIPANTILLTTLETNRDDYFRISGAPPASIRYQAFKDLDYPKKIVTVEPIMDFDLDVFVDWIVNLKPLAVFIGYNSHPKQVRLIEPHMEKTLDLIVALKNKGVRVLTKELRKMAYRDFESRRQETRSEFKMEEEYVKKIRKEEEKRIPKSLEEEMMKEAEE